MLLSRKVSLSLFLAILALAPLGFRPLPALAAEAGPSHAQKAAPHPQKAPALLGRPHGKVSPVIDAHSALPNTDQMPVAAGVTVITRQEIAANHYDSVAEALTYAPGVTVTGGVVNTSQRIVRIDGDERVAVFIDGHRMNLESGLTNGRSTYDLDMAVPPSAIERIEVIRGMADGGYLNYDTPGGAINIVTRKGRDHQVRRKEPGVPMTAGAGAPIWKAAPKAGAGWPPEAVPTWMPSTTGTLPAAGTPCPIPPGTGGKCSTDSTGSSPIPPP